MTSPAHSYLKATFWERLAALLIDELILFIPVFIIQITRISASEKTIIETIITLLYNIFLLNYQGATFGKKFMKIKVVSNSYSKVTPGKIILRETLAKWISNVFVNLGNLWVLIDKDRQAWHDKITKTYVVKVDTDGEPIPGVNPPISLRNEVFFTIFVILSIFVYLLALAFLAYN